MYLLLVQKLLKLQMPLDLIHPLLRLYLCFLQCLYSEFFLLSPNTSSLETIQKAVNAFVSKVETKVDKILREFIFRSGARLLTDPSEPHTQATQSQDTMPK